MPDKLKDVLFSQESLHRFVDAIREAYPSFDYKRFFGLVLDETWAGRELKDRMRRVTECLHSTLPAEFGEALEILDKAIPAATGFLPMVCSDYVARYGLEDWDLSLTALARFTRFGSSEYAIRPFIFRDAERTMAVLLRWAADENEHVRRLASEGCRPRLPWGFALERFKRDPRPILPILEQLKSDESEYVRTSVANNLNDISKDHPEIALDVARKWYGRDPRTDWIVRRGLRTLLKAGNRQALELIGVSPNSRVVVSGFEVEQSVVPMGSSIDYGFVVEIRGDEPSQVRLELRVDYARPRGRSSRKIFAIRTASLEPGSHTFKRRLSLAPRSTRQNFPGPHRLALIVNGSLAAEAMVEVIRA